MFKTTHHLRHCCCSFSFSFFFSEREIQTSRTRRRRRRRREIVCFPSLFYSVFCLLLLLPFFIYNQPLSPFFTFSLPFSLSLSLSGSTSSTMNPRCFNNGRHGYNMFQNLTLMPPPPSSNSNSLPLFNHSSPSSSLGMGLQFLGATPDRPGDFPPWEKGKAGVRLGDEEEEEEEEGDGDGDHGKTIIGYGGGGKNRRHTKLCARGHWRPAEDAKLKELVAHYGPQNWNLIAENLHGRSGKSCRLRWFNQLDPRINRKAFNEEEEERLLSAHRLYGNKWAMIARLFPGRTDNAVKNHWHVIMARKHREQSNLYRSRSRKPPPKEEEEEQRDVTTTTFHKHNNVSCESTISSTVDESAASTSTELSLSTFLHLTAGSPSAMRKLGYPALMENSRRGGGGGGADQSGNSESNSEASVAESVISTNLSLASGETANGADDIKMRFIDFLGVGAS